MFSRLKRRFYTYKSIKKVIAYIKISNDTSFQIGREFCTIYYIIYKEFKNNDLYNTEHIWTSLNKITGFKDMVLFKYINEFIDFPRFFSKLNLNILRLPPLVLSCYFRGYYINDMNLFSTNIISGHIDDDKINYMVLYDNHYHYLLFLYNYLSTNHTNTIRGVNIQLNSMSDLYSINDDSDQMCYKLIFEKKEFDFIDPIRLLLNFLYSGVADVDDTLGPEDRYLYLSFLKYKTIH